MTKNAWRWPLLFGAGLLVISAAWWFRAGTRPAGFRTVPLVPERVAWPASKTLKFAVWGDSGSGGAGQAELAAQIARFDPQFLVHTGDLIYPRGAWRDYDSKFWAPYQSLLQNRPFYGCLGNHDLLTARGEPFLTAFQFPRNGPANVEAERNYRFGWGDVEFWVIDANASEREMNSHLAPWLEEGLHRSRATWKIAVWHQPPWSSGLHGDNARTKKLLVPVLLRNGADLLFNGHDHTYERFKAVGKLTAIVTGAGGAVRYVRRRKDARTAAFHNEAFSFSAVEIHG